jgi:hypothetical protein
VVEVLYCEVESGEGDGVGPAGQAVVVDHLADHQEARGQLLAGQLGLVFGEQHTAHLHSVEEGGDHQREGLVGRRLYLGVVVSHLLDDLPPDLIQVVLHLSRLGQRLALSVGAQHFLQDGEGDHCNLEVGLADAELDHIGEAADEVGLLVLLLDVGQHGVEALEVVLPVLREELANRHFVKVLLHEARLFYVLALNLLHRWQLSRLLLALLLGLGFYAVAAKGGDHALIVVIPFPF